MEQTFLDYKPEWKTAERANAEGWEYTKKPNFKVLKEAGWYIESMPYMSGWALFLVRGE